MFTRVVVVFIAVLMSGCGLLKTSSDNSSSINSDAINQCPASRRIVDVEVNPQSLPNGVIVTRKNASGLPIISNASTTALVFFIENKPEAAETPRPADTGLPEGLYPTQKFEAGKVYTYYQSGVPMQGLEHLTGWQNPENITESLLPVQSDPECLRDESQFSAKKDFSVDAFYGGQRITIRGQIVYEKGGPVTSEG